MAKALRDISRFMRFDLDGWLDGKELSFVGIEVWRDKDTKEPCGSRVHLVVTADVTDYPYDDVTNVGGQLTVKVRGVSPEQFDGFVPFQTVVEVVDVEKAVPWRAGEYASQDISIIAKVRAARSASSKGGDE